MMTPDCNESAQASFAVAHADARELEQVWVCSVQGFSPEFVTTSEDVSRKWVDKNRWHRRHLVPVQPNEKGQL